MSCSKCGRNVKITAYATFRTRKGEVRRRGICKDCRNKYARDNFKRLQVWRKNYNIKNRTAKRERDYQRKVEARAITDSIKASTPCTDCHRFFPPICMDFDHLSGKNKSIASMVSQGYKIELILEEIKLCDVVCACCHRVRTAKRKQNLAPTRTKETT